jgi:hypothetical protein
MTYNETRASSLRISTLIIVHEPREEERSKRGRPLDRALCKSCGTNPLAGGNVQVHSSKIEGVEPGPHDH